LALGNTPADIFLNPAQLFVYIGYRLFRCGLLTLALLFLEFALLRLPAFRKPIRE
jgi:hypothetical protein